MPFSCSVPKGSELGRGAHEECTTAIVIAAVERSIADQVEDARRNAGQLRVREVPDTGGEGEVVEIKLTRNGVDVIIILLEEEDRRRRFFTDIFIGLGLVAVDPFH